MKNSSWLEAFSHELKAAGVSQIDQASATVETEGFLQESDCNAFDHFGPPQQYAARVIDALGPQLRPVGTGPQSRPHLVVERVGKAYRGRAVLSDVSLRVQPGDLLALTGPNGAGKSTLLRLIAGLEPLDRGTITVEGRIGYAPQEGGIDPYLRPNEHFVFFGAASGLSRSESTREGNRLAVELGWDAETAPVAGELSGGTRQKLSIITALLGRPRILLLDEPYQGMDAESTRRFWDLLASWRDSGRSAVVSSHSPDALAHATSVHEIDGLPAR